MSKHLYGTVSFGGISSVLAMLSVHVKQKWLKRMLKFVQG